MKIKGKIPLLIVAALGWVVVISSCANIGMPTGGPKDTIPPAVLSTSPELRALNYKGEDVRFTFNEYIRTDKISDALVISPPLSKRPSIKTKSKTLIVQFNEELRDSVTYSFDFKNSVVDNNEGNPLENLRFSFATGPEYDSLRVAGRVVNAFDLEPIESCLVLLQSNLHDSAIFKVIPDYIAKTDEEGLFMIDNIAAGSYNLFAVNDLNNDMLYNEGAEEIAFVDELIIPRAEFHEAVDADTVVNGLDSMLVVGHTHFYPDPVYLRYFMEDIFEQYIDKAERENRYQCLFLFNESVEDTFGIRLLTDDNKNWYTLEHNQNMDSIVLWITDTTLAKMDSLYMELSYFMVDSTDAPYLFTDTVLMHYSDPEIVSDRRRKKEEDQEEEVVKPVVQFDWKISLPSTMELNGQILLEAPQPLAGFDSSMVNLFLTEDTLKTPLDFQIKKVESAWRTYVVDYKWEPETKYTFSIDSATCTNIYGITSKRYARNFETREEDYYGSLVFEFSGVPDPMIVQVLKNNKEEQVMRSKKFDSDGTVDFTLLAPEKYKVKVIYDTNGNGKWDSGSFQDKIQPERVTYLNEVIKLRSNWSETRIWDVTVDPEYTKNIIDQEAEEKKRKEAEEKARKEKQEEQNDSMFRPGNTGGNSSGRSGVNRMN